ASREEETKSSKFSYQDKILLAGQIASKVKEYAKKIIKKNMLLSEIAENIESKIQELGGKPAFPVNTSINELAAHYTPSHNDSSIAHGLLKVDLGVHIDGWIADTAISIDLENSEENKKLIQASKDALENAIELVSKKIEKKEILTTGEIGKKIQETIESKGFLPIINLSGHQIEKYNLHAGLTIPNIDNKSTEIISPGLYAIEPFVTDGNGKIRDGKPSGIYMLTNPKTPRTPIAREVLEYIGERYQALPFCSRWLVKKFGMKTTFALKQLEENGNLHQFPQLIESSNSKVAQAEHTILITNGKVSVTT
ncbi:MAG: type II methionyl aminopeptidase, partial [Nanoarchaeota archaeon]